METPDRTLIRRLNSISEGGYTLTALNQDSSIDDTVITGVILKSAAEIVWHRWRKKIKNITV